MKIKVFTNAQHQIYATADGRLLQIDVDNISEAGIKALKSEEDAIYLSPTENLLIMDYEPEEETVEEAD